MEQKHNPSSSTKQRKKVTETGFEDTVLKLISYEMAYGFAKKDIHSVGGGGVSKTQLRSNEWQCL